MPAMTHLADKLIDAALDETGDPRVPNVERMFADMLGDLDHVTEAAVHLARAVASMVHLWEQNPEGDPRTALALVRASWKEGDPHEARQ